MATSDSALRNEVRPPREVPCLLVRSGRVYAPGEGGPALIRTPAGGPLEVFDAFDRLTPDHRRIYIADLDGIEHGEPQLDLWQELSRDAELWIDGGVQKADQAIDILVSGARRAVLSTGRLRGERELAKAWALSQEIAVEVEYANGRVLSHDGGWSSAAPEEVAARIRAAGPSILVVSPRGEDVDWSLVQRIARGGTTYVDGGYPKGGLDRLVAAGARGGIYHPDPATLGGVTSLPVSPE